MRDIGGMGHDDDGILPTSRFLMDILYDEDYQKTSSCSEITIFQAATLGDNMIPPL